MDAITPPQVDISHRRDPTENINNVHDVNNVYVLCATHQGPIGYSPKSLYTKQFTHIILLDT
jgi:hypothetical protein